VRAGVTDGKHSKKTREWCGYKGLKAGCRLCLETEEEGVIISRGSYRHPGPGSRSQNRTREKTTGKGTAVETLKGRKKSYRKERPRLITIRTIKGREDGRTFGKVGMGKV